MGLLSSIIAKGVVTAARNSTIKAAGDAVATLIATKASADAAKDDIVVKNGVTLIKPTRSSDDYCGENALEIARELLGAGFESVTLKPVKTLSERARKRYGKVESISINGKNEFLGVKKLPSTSYIVIEYSDFKKNVDMSVYAGVTKITPGTMQRDEPKATAQENSVPPQSKPKKFCPYCGNALAIEGAKFCSCCGKQI